MRRPGSEGHPALLLVAVVVSLFALMAGQIRFGPMNGVEGLLLDLISPVLKSVETVETWSAEAASFVTGSDSPGRVHDLERELAGMRLEVQRLREQSIENARLRALLDLKESLPVPVAAATVLSNAFRGVSKTCLIDKGSADGLAPDMGVVNSQGIVGRIRSVGRGISKIQLITDAASGVAVLVQRSRVQGVLVGRGDPVLELRYVSMLDDVQPHDLLVTSGLDGIYPKGLPVGVVAEVGAGAGQLRSITVIPRVEFDRLEDVLVLLRNDLPVEMEGLAP
ncbi:MAG TPA: rod shape-determining protein MreC [Candidatus Saccharimonadales bacterium]|nr:rod shape-determining protein MreC [Candidatus Saccharimonadales bacterium]